MGASSKGEEPELRRRTLAEVVWSDFVHIVYFMTPLVVMHNAAWYVILKKSDFEKT
jgi:hypothetical protein